MASTLLALGSLTLREGNCHVVKILQQPVQRVHLVRKRLSAKMLKKKNIRLLLKAMGVSHRPASIKASDDFSWGWNLHHNLMRHLQSEPPS